MFSAASQRSLAKIFERSRNPAQAELFAEAALLFIAALTMRDPEPAPAAEPVEPPDVEPVIVPLPEEPDVELLPVVPSPEEPTMPDPSEIPLEEVPGIGPEEAERLMAVGIGGLRALAALADQSRIVWDSYVTPENVKRWQTAAQRILDARAQSQG